MNSGDMISTADQIDSPFSYAMTQQDIAIYQTVKKAIREKNVLLAYQPVMSARRKGTPAFYEGLIRIMDDDHNILPAADFMHVAETQEAGRIIDCLSLELGLKALAEEPSFRLSINMSARSIGYPRWTQTLNIGLDRDATVAERLILEITESSAMVLPDLVSVFMARMHRRGISFALDDFGAGYTAFRYLKDFYFDIVKIDGQFTRKTHDNTDNQVLAAALLSIAGHFDMLTVAEAVEGPAEAAYLTAMGFDCLQGYYFGMPETMPPWETEDAKQPAVAGT